MAAFMVGLARRSHTAEDLLARLEETETLRVADPSAQAFAQQLWEWVRGRRGSSEGRGLWR